ncbi:hydroxyacylglutathione hydrolase [Marichromatium gracile]|uniref:Hydroxyacylglutathione hydrolase n=1 Tax=Marichromatium gracile TaxID=1048 RepID=A0A4R4AH90_MARGR|nr:hydroxyacylglutathione hydrolase [Marichromatium gracile]MBK1710519.1 hydroxyacylglutathione hydrolase [Marichromatium gracile]MBO8086996.1 hydroxyacylglutathione hydrolase [Marichromatium sp.]TCW38344.1 hydroxyacylglutathione hydrolase [Marichromatium gracile]
MLEPIAIPAFEDNYIWLLRAPGGAGATLVDPGEAAPVLAYLSEHGLHLEAVLLTHHHGDHIGGVETLCAAFPEAVVYAPEDARIALAHHRVGEGDAIEPAGLGVTFRVLEVPGHTATHVAYLGEGRLFCGDTLFAAGCGRVFDGTAEQLARSLARIARLAPETRCYCAHEYTEANLGFAQWVEPQHAALEARIAAVRAARAAGRATVPSTLAEELATNPFLRVAVPEVRAAAERFAGEALEEPAAVFAALRRWKDECYD